MSEQSGPDVTVTKIANRNNIQEEEYTSAQLRVSEVSVHGGGGVGQRRTAYIMVGLQIEVEGYSGCCPFNRLKPWEGDDTHLQRKEKPLKKDMNKFLHETVTTNRELFLMVKRLKHKAWDLSSQPIPHPLGILLLGVVPGF